MTMLFSHHSVLAHDVAQSLKKNRRKRAQLGAALEKVIISQRKVVMINNAALSCCRSQ
jgi:hypothetical protein